MSRAPALALALALGGCATVPEPLARALEEYPTVAEAAAPCLASAAAAELAACETDRCRAEARARWGTVAAALETMRAAWCALAAHPDCEARP